MTDRKIGIAEMFRDNETLAADQLAKMSPICSESLTDFFYRDLEGLLQIQRSANRGDDLIGQRGALRGFADVAVKFGLANCYRRLIGDRSNQIRFPAGPAVRPIAMMQAQNSNRLSIDANRSSQN